MSTILDKSNSHILGAMFPLLCSLYLACNRPTKKQLFLPSLLVLQEEEKMKGKKEQEKNC